MGYVRIWGIALWGLQDISSFHDLQPSGKNLRTLLILIDFVAIIPIVYVF